MEFINASGLHIAGPTSYNALERMVALIEKYRDTPMDYADATLIILAESCKTHRICTLDFKGFNTYRALDGKPFVII
jgi:uncharacterized protein